MWEAHGGLRQGPLYKFPSCRPGGAPAAQRPIPEAKTTMVLSGGCVTPPTAPTSSFPSMWREIRKVPHSVLETERSAACDPFTWLCSHRCLVPERSHPPRRPRSHELPFSVPPHTRCGHGSGLPSPTTRRPWSIRGTTCPLRGESISVVRVDRPHTRVCHEAGLPPPRALSKHRGTSAKWEPGLGQVWG